MITKHEVANILGRAAWKLRNGDFGHDGQQRDADSDTFIEWIENELWRAKSLDNDRFVLTNAAVAESIRKCGIHIPYISAESGVSVATIYRIINNQHKARLPVLRSLAMVTGMAND